MKLSMKRSLSLALTLVIVLSLFTLPMQVHAATLTTKQLQMNLIGLGYLPSGSADGIYGSKTTSAVSAYQGDNSLKVDGIAGTNTKNSIYKKVKYLQMNLKGLGYMSASADGIYGEKTTTAVKAYQGDYGLTANGIARANTLNSITKKVKYLQMNLRGLGYMSASADGIYGEKTTTAVKAYQGDYGLTANGIARTNTLNSINQKVKYLQLNLKGLGYMSASADGIYGERTTTAVTNYQNANNLGADGIAGPKTLPSINRKVEYLEHWLKSLGYLSGKPDNVYGTNTTTAVKNIQKFFRESAIRDGAPTLPKVTGIADIDTYDAIRSHYFHNCG